MTEDQIQTFVDLAEWAEMLDLHPVDMAQAVEREIDAELAAQHADWLDEKKTLEDARY